MKFNPKEMINKKKIKTRSESMPNIFSFFISLEDPKYRFFSRVFGFVVVSAVIDLNIGECYQ